MIVPPPNPDGASSRRRLVGAALAAAVAAGLLGLVAFGAIFPDRETADDAGERFVRTAAAEQVSAPGREPRPEPDDPVEIGDAAPALVLPDLEAGRMVDLADWRGRVVVLNVWGSWCPPCVREMPSLQRLHEKAGERVVVVTVTVDETRPAARRLVERFGLTMPVLMDPGGARLAEWGTVKYPETWILTPEGIVAERVVGESDWADPAVLGRLQGLGDG